MGAGHRQWIALSAALALAAALPATAAANPGDLDPSFAEIGKISREGSTANAVAVQGDAKILVLSYSSLYRLNADGTRDKSYGKKGSAALDFPDSYSGVDAADVVALADGSSLISGYITTKSDAVSVSVVRHLADGSLDKSFGVNGAATVPLVGLGRDDDLGAKIAVQADGRILIAGSAGGTPQVARLMATGVPDPSFDGGAAVAVALGPDDTFGDVAAAAGGTVVVEGSVSPAQDGETDLAVARLKADGAPDTTFSGDGVAVADLGGRETGAGVVVQPDGKIIAAGTSRLDCRGTSCGRSAIALARFDTGGALDPTFGTAGLSVVSPPAGIGAGVAGIALAADGKLVVGGGSSDFLVARFDSAGALDPGFGEDGFAWTPFRGYYTATAQGMALAPDGNIVVAGYILLEEAYDELAIARYLGDGAGADIDADGVTDTDDACPHNFGTIASGCPYVARSMSLKYDAKKRKLFGRIGVGQKSGEPLSGYLVGTPRLCADNTSGSAVLFERRRGADRKVDTDRTPASLEFKVPGRGDYYARIGKALVTAFSPDGPVELCGRAKSNVVGIGH